jgi:uncharacterized phiE125 gp8 family phage protein
MSLLDKPLSLNCNFQWKVTTAPASEPITAADVKSYGIIETDDDDTLIGTMITGVREMAERWTGRAFIEQTITAYLDYWPEKRNWIQLPRPPLTSVTGIYTIDEDDAETEYSSDYYYTITTTNYGKVVIKNDATPPYNYDRYTGGIKIVYKAGYGDAAEDVPQALRLGLIEWVMYAYENRVMSRIPPVDSMPFIGAYKIRRI